MNRHISEHNRMRRFRLHAIFGTLFILAYLLLSVLANNVGWGVFGIFDFPALPSVLVLPDLFTGATGQSWFATLGLTGLLTLLLVLLTAFCVTAYAIPRPMKAYWIKQIIHSKETSVKCAAAWELGRTRDPDAFLLLIDVAEDESEDADVRKSAAEALQAMSTEMRGRGYEIAVLKSLIGKGDPQRIIGILKSRGDNCSKSNVHVAFVIARQLMKLGRYHEARDWLRKALYLDNRDLLYDGRLESLIGACNEKLLAEGDALFMEENFQGAREYYARVSNGLTDCEKKHFAVFLRAACVYCKLRDYANADQAVLQALRFGQETDKSLVLVDLLHRFQDLMARGRQVNEPRRRIEQSIDESVSRTMSELVGDRQILEV